MLLIVVAQLPHCQRVVSLEPVVFATWGGQCWMPINVNNAIVWQLGQAHTVGANSRGVVCAGTERSTLLMNIKIPIYSLNCCLAHANTSVRRVKWALFPPFSLPADPLKRYRWHLLRVQRNISERSNQYQQEPQLNMTIFYHKPKIDFSGHIH